MAVNGPYPLDSSALFACGLFALGEVAAVTVYKSDPQVQERDKETGLPLWQFDAMDPDPKAWKEMRTFRVKIAAAGPAGAAGADPGHVASPDRAGGLDDQRVPGDGQGDGQEAREDRLRGAGERLVCAEAGYGSGGLRWLPGSTDCEVRPVVARLSPGCVVSASVSERANGQVVTLQCGPGLVVLVDSPAVLDRLATAAMDGLDQLGLRRSIRRETHLAGRRIDRIGPAGEGGLLSDQGSAPTFGGRREDWLTIREAAALIGVCRETLWAWNRVGKGPQQVRAAKRRPVYYRPDVEAWLGRSAA